MAVLQLYANILSLSSPLRTELAGTALTHLLFFWLPSFLFLLITYLLPPTFPWRTQPSQPPPSLPTLINCILLVLANQLLGLLLQYSICLLWQHHFNHPLFPSTTPTRSDILRSLSTALAIGELLFYTTHRLLHNPRLFRHIHILHHAFTAPISLSAHYAHPVEYILTSWLPIIAGAAVGGGGVVGLWAVMGVVEMVAVGAHSGVKVGGLAMRHDRHHEGGVVGGYATFEAVDWVFGTDMRVVGRGGKIMGE